MHNVIDDEQLLSANLLGIADLETLYIAERRLTAFNEARIEKHSIVGNFDYKHLKAIHKALFEQIYDFAGKDRYESGFMSRFGKESGGVAAEFTNPLDLPDHSKRLFDNLHRQNLLKDLEIDEFRLKSAEFFANLNALQRPRS
ncbi:hypothetical protein FACS189487_10360 [Campylobacterota bacterium]|nr:hypothetical protein FACS189487_10360 [Campylobacterota bacterium]